VKDPRLMNSTFGKNFWSNLSGEVEMLGKYRRPVGGERESAKGSIPKGEQGRKTHYQRNSSRKRKTEKKKKQKHTRGEGMKLESLVIRQTA